MSAWPAFWASVQPKHQSTKAPTSDLDSQQFHTGPFHAFPILPTRKGHVWKTLGSSLQYLKLLFDTPQCVCSFVSGFRDFCCSLYLSVWGNESSSALQEFRWWQNRTNFFQRDSEPHKGAEEQRLVGKWCIRWKWHGCFLIRLNLLFDYVGGCSPGRIVWIM